jgi:hypothetical protein
MPVDGAAASAYSEVFESIGMDGLEKNEDNWVTVEEIEQPNDVKNMSSVDDKATTISC